MADIEITDEASLEAWLKTRPRRDAEIIAFRADLRAFPFWIRQEGQSSSIEPKPSTLPLLQLILAKFFSQRSTSKLYLVNRYPKLSKSSPAFAPFMAMSSSAAANAASAAAKAAEASLKADEQSATAVVDAFDAVNRFHFFRKIADEIQGSSWLAIGADAANLDVGHNPARDPLWATLAPDWFTAADRETRAIWAKDPATWAFWEKWWDGVISGDMPFAPELLRDVALIENDIWEAGPKAVAEAIRAIEATRSPQTAQELSADQVLDRAIAKLPPAKDTAVAAVRQAVIAHRADLLENFAALQGFIALEITRLQTINYMSNEHRDLCIQQVKTLSVIALTVDRLGSLVPKQAGKEPDAEKIESLGRVYLNLLQEWPRSNAREVVDTTCRLSLVGMGSAVAWGLGLPVGAISAVLAAGYLAPPMVKVVVEGKKQKKKK